ncbi:MAG: YlbF family regulator [Ruminiclostridium sp.]|nr:YlbF family regulator [Ruminiclostridium sp.]
MDAITAARELGKAIQADQRYKDYVAAKAANDADEALQGLISDFSAKRQLLSVEMQKEQSEQDAEKIRVMNKDMQDAYGEVMKNVNMANFAVVKNALDILLNEVNMIISLSCEGEDPDTCDPHASHGCGGNCGSCGGCG